MPVAGAGGAHHRPLSRSASAAPSAAASPMRTRRPAAAGRASRSMRELAIAAPRARGRCAAARVLPVGVCTTALQPDELVARRRLPGAQRRRGLRLPHVQPAPRRLRASSRSRPLSLAEAGDVGDVRIGLAASRDAGAAAAGRRRSCVGAADAALDRRGAAAAAAAAGAAGGGRRAIGAVPARTGRTAGRRSALGRRAGEREDAAMTSSAITLPSTASNIEFVAEPRKLLSDALREDCGLTGTHVGCEHGVCGACTVLVDGRPARACLMLRRADGRATRSRPSRRVAQRRRAVAAAAGAARDARPAVRLLHAGHRDDLRGLPEGQSRPERGADPRRARRATCAAAPATRTSSRRSLAAPRKLPQARPVR